jgi:hypothetical protein
LFFNPSGLKIELLSAHKKAPILKTEDERPNCLRDISSAARPSAEALAKADPWLCVAGLLRLCPFRRLLLEGLSWSMPGPVIQLLFPGWNNAYLLPEKISAYFFRL